MRVLAAVSGGVDSAVAMARAVAAGHDVTAVHMALSADPSGTPSTGSPKGSGSGNGSGSASGKGCCTIADAHDARRAADVVGIPFYVWDLAEEFRHTVVADFVAEYAAGRTPNPCIRCNQHVKFAALLDRAMALGFDAVATGHYARLEDAPEGPVLRRAADRDKDQSYVLAVLGSRRLRHAMFPLGDTLKSQVRDEARRRGLLVADKADSHDICFIPDGDTAGFLQRRLGSRPGNIVDAESGSVLGRHDGTYRFTVGQRRGLGITTAAPSGNPRYVLSISPVSGDVLVGERDRLAVTTIACESAVWCAPVPDPGAELHVQIRAHGAAVPGVVTRRDAGFFAVRLAGAAKGVASGQSCVLYDDDRVIGQGTIAATGP